MQESIRDNRRFVLIGLVVLILLCLVAVLIYRIFFTEDGLGQVTPIPPVLTPTEEGPVVIVTPEEAEEEVTPTPTRVIAESPDLEDTTEPPDGETATPAATTTATATAAAPATGPPGATPTVSGAVSGPADGVTTAPAQAVRIEQLLENGDFEGGFDNSGVARGWNSFKTDSVVVGFAPETSAPYVKSGENAQRITVLGATQGDRYAGIYQQAEVIPNRVYTLTLNGQIRTGLGDVNQTSYGYRMQYAIDYQGGTDWRDIPQEQWVELPWDEQLMDTADVNFLTYTRAVTATSDEMTIFVRAWNKWANPAEVHYTLDSLSLVGPELTGPAPPLAMAEARPTEEALIDQPLPTTGAGDGPSLVSDGRFWGAVLVLLLLAGGAVFRARWEW